jgi:hypothetical protein
MVTGRFNNCKTAREKNAAANPPTTTSKPERLRNQTERKERGRVRTNLIILGEKYSPTTFESSSVIYETAIPEIITINKMSIMDTLLRYSRTFKARVRIN